jgi:hypothetical protein
VNLRIEVSQCAPALVETIGIFNLHTVSLSLHLEVMAASLVISWFSPRALIRLVPRYKPERFHFVSQNAKIDCA